MVIEGKEIPDALHVPRQAVLEKNGKTHVFVKVGDRFEQREVKVEHLTESRAAIAGVAEGTEVALSDPTLRAADQQQLLADASGRRDALEMAAPRIIGTTSDFLPELRLGFENLRAHKLRSLLTMMGMIFGVAAVVAMLSIGAGAQQEVMAFIEQLGVRNLIVEARESTDYQVVQKVRQLSAGLTFHDYRVIQANLDDISASTRAQAVRPVEAAAAAAERSAGRLRRQPAVHADREPAGRGRALLRRRARPTRRRRWRCSARARRRRSSAPTTRSAGTSRSTSSGSR